MNCDCTEKISSLIDGELVPAEARKLERHLLNCLECQEARVDFLNLRSKISDFPVAFNPVGQRETLSRILGKGGVVGSPQRWRWVFNPAVVAVASLLIVGTVIALLIYPRSKPTPVSSDEIASGPKKRTPAATPSPADAGVQKGRGQQNNAVPKSSPPPAGTDKNKGPNRKRAPLMFEPSQDNIASKQTETNDTLAENDLGLNEPTRVRSADAETMTAIHFQKSELLLRSFRNVRLTKPGMSPELDYEKKLAQKLVYQNMMLRREADASGDTQVASLLESLEPILLDIANIPDTARPSDVRTIKDRVERKNIVALLQVNSTALARALD
jgi:hypothetical protein